MFQSGKVCCIAHDSCKLSLVFEGCKRWRLQLECPASFGKYPLVCSLSEWIMHEECMQGHIRALNVYLHCKVFQHNYYLCLCII